MGQNKIRGRNLIRTVLLAAAIIFLAAGIKTGGFYDVKSISVMICMECIGIG